jgi:uncharacterized delta-60 repeat protein
VNGIAGFSATFCTPRFSDRIVFAKMKIVRGMVLLPGVISLAIFLGGSCSLYSIDGDTGRMRPVACVGGPGRVTGTVVASLHDGGFLVAGSFEDTVIFGQGEDSETALESIGDSDLFVARFNGDGTLGWVRWAFSDGGVSAAGLSVLEGGGFMLTGGVGAWDLPEGTVAVFGHKEPNETVLSIQGDYDMYLARFDAGGKLVWVRQCRGGGSESGRALSALPDGSVLVAGSFSKTATFGAGEPKETRLSTYEYSSDAFVARYDPDGALDWAFRIGAVERDYASGVHFLADGSFLLAGVFSYAVDFDPSPNGLAMMESDYDTDIFLARYTNGGSLSWVRRAGGMFTEGLNDLSVSPDGSFAATGYLGGAGMDTVVESTFGPGEPGETVLSCRDQYDMFAARYTPDGFLVWAKNGTSTRDWINWNRGNGVTALPDGSVLATGEFRNSITFGRGEENRITLATAEEDDEDLFVSRYLPDGSLDWAARIGGEHNDWGNATAVLPDGSVLLTGAVREGSTYEFKGREGMLSCPGNGSVLVVKIEP